MYKYTSELRAGYRADELGINALLVLEDYLAYKKSKAQMEVFHRQFDKKIILKQYIFSV
jgi:hypothetical protein